MAKDNILQQERMSKNQEKGPKTDFISKYKSQGYRSEIQF